MAGDRRRAVPRTFFLNESHEAGAAEKEGGGRLPAYAPVQWAAKAKRLSQTLQRVEQTIVASKDPLKDERFFVLANPVHDVEKMSTNKKKAPEGKYNEQTEFGGVHGRVFERLGMDLLQVTDAGQAIVHAKKATMASFGIVPLHSRISGLASSRGGLLSTHLKQFHSNYASTQDGSII